jgi:DNA-binding GntR family transcriptional regulator
LPLPFSDIMRPFAGDQPWNKLRVARPATALLRLEKATQMLERTPQTVKEPSAADIAYGGIIDLVLNSELRPGERTSVNLLAARLDLGRTPVKEAITRLQTEGLLSVAGRSGTIVKQIDRAQTEQLFALRRALEDFAADFAVQNVTAKDLQQIRKCLQKLGRSNSTSEFVRANVEFHSLIVATAANPFLIRFYSQLQIQLQIVTYLLQRGFDTKAADARQREHAIIVKALEKKDAQALKSALHAHALTTERAILATLTADSERREKAAIGRR